MPVSKHFDIIMENLSFAYDKKPVLENVDLKISHGEFASIVGPNGGGKTTLLKIILGLLKPDKGEIKIFGGAPQKARARMGYMPQYAHLDPQFPVTVADVVLMGRLRRNMGWRYLKKDRKTVEECLAEVNLAEHINDMFSELSGGQRQRVLIARALSSKPDLLLLDEPTANIDPEGEESLFETLADLNKRMTILLVSHDIGFVSQVVKSVICVNRRVLVHPTSRINGTIIKDIYGGDFDMIRHDHRCSEKGHSHD